MSSRTLYRALCAALLGQGVTAVVAATTAWSGLLQAPVLFGAFISAQAVGIVAVAFRYVFPGSDLRFVAVGGAVALGALIWLGTTSLAGPSLVEQIVRTGLWVVVLVGLHRLWPRVARIEEAERGELGDVAA
ncbi:MAG: hypothetical protein R3E12_11845 [Candidatus Eisenbacteria bacterium]